MEEAEVKQLISLIESAQLQYEVDESGTVSIVCDPVQLVDSASIENSQENVDVSAESLLPQHNGATVPSEEVSGVAKDVSGITILENEGKEGVCLERTGEIKVENEEIPVMENEEIPDIQQSKTTIIHEASQSAPPIHYFLQTPDGEIIQVLEPLDVNEGTAEGISQSLENITSGTSLTDNTEASSDENMQILVVSNGNSGDMFLINAPDRAIESQENGDHMDVPQALLKSEGDESSMECISTIPKSLEPMTSDHVDSASKGTDDLFLNVALIDDNSSSISKVSASSSKMIVPQMKDDIQCRKDNCSKDVTLSATSSARQYVRLDSQTKPRYRDTLSNLSMPSTLEEGSVIRTEKGEMMAFNLTSITKCESTGKKSVMQSIASSFGSLVKVLRPIDQEKEVGSTNVKKRFNLFTCEECGTILHSERSLRIHCRRYHEEWDDDCFICGEKFLNQLYVRNHIREMHSGEKSFQCRFCSFRCALLKDFFKHRRVHKKSQACDTCGKKYTSPKLYQDHVAVCRPENNLELEELCDVSDYQNKIEKCLDKKDEYVPYQIHSDMASGRKKSIRQDHVNKAKRDLEYKVESKHYSQQIKKMALEQPVQHRRRGRDRTHRCYLCFKLFQNSDALEAHKEVYHQVKSSHPVRVKTDDALGKEDEEALASASVASFQACINGLNEDVQIKEEPPDLIENLENVTLVIDECMNLHQVIKPLCIACRAYTKTDFRDSCKLFQNISKYDQSEVLKHFEKFFPCTLDPESLTGSWVLCKKCAILIDKITNMEEKLMLMKNNFLQRLQCNSGIVEKNPSDKCTGDNLKSELIDNKCTESLMNSSEVTEEIDKSLASIENFMKENCEIMEIIQPHRKVQGTRKHGAEKLAPVLLSDDELDDIVSTNVDKAILKKLENDSSEPETNNSMISIKPCLILGNIKKEACEESVDECPGIMTIKTEPHQQDLESVLPDSSGSTWESIEKSALNSVERLESDDFLLSMSKTKKDDQLHSELFDVHLLSERVEGEDSLRKSDKSEVGQTFEKGKVMEICEVKENGDPEVFMDSESQEPLCKLSAKPEEGDPAMQFTRIQEALQDMEDKDISDDKLEKDDDDCVTTTNDVSEGKRTTRRVLRTMQKPTMVKNRAKMREERNLMCYRLEGNAKKPWVCNGCHKGFSSQRGACDHYAASHGGQSYSCEHCSASYVRKRDLIGHYNKVHLKAKPYKCKKCSETFSMHSQLYRHMHSVHMETKKEGTVYSCHLCEATFSQKRYRDSHVITCETKGSAVSPYNCVKCMKSFKLERYLRLHMRTAHSIKTDAFFCEICNKVLNDKRNLVLHMKSHNGETKTSCAVCHKQFSRKAYLWTHMRVHTNERPYGCNYCPKWFKQYSTWKNHERTHTGEKPYKCNICNSCFATSSSVSKHLQYAHYNIREFGCTFCSKNFISKAKLDEHMKTHTGEKPFKCPICDRAFNKKTNLRTHMYIHSDNKRFKCELCGEGFMRRTAIENHVLDRHIDLEMFIIGTTNTERSKADSITALTNPYITVVGADEVNSEDTYIVVYADEDKEIETTKDMQVTVLAEDLQTKHETVETTGRNLQSPLSVLPKVIIREEKSVDESEDISTLIATESDVPPVIPMDVTPSQITYGTYKEF